MIVWETFHWPGKYPVFKMLLNIWVIALIPTSGNSFKIFQVIRSCPGGFFESTCFIADRTSGCLNFLIGITNRPGVSRACRISRSSSSGISELYSLKTFAKCSASTFAHRFLPILPLHFSAGGLVFVAALVFRWLSIVSIPWLAWLTSFQNKFE